MSLTAAKAFQRGFGRLHSLVYRLTRGRLGGSFRSAPVLLLTTTGRKTGQPRTMPLLYVRDGERIAVAASAGGVPANPAWFLNLQANPEVEVELGGERRAMRAREADGEERERLWRELVAIYGAYERYQRKTTRRIPVVVLEPERQRAPEGAL